MEAELVARLHAAKTKRTLAMKEPDVAKDLDTKMLDKYSWLTLINTMTLKRALHLQLYGLQIKNMVSRQGRGGWPAQFITK